MIKTIVLKREAELRFDPTERTFEIKCPFCKTAAAGFLLFFKEIFRCLKCNKEIKILNNLINRVTITQFPAVSPQERKRKKRCSRRISLMEP